MTLEHGWRYTVLALVFALIGGLIFGQTVRIQVSPQAEDFIKQGDLYAGEWRTVTPPRGQLYDRWGNLLAGNRTTYEIGVELAYVEDPQAIAFVLNAVLGLEYSTVFAAASIEPSDTAVYARLADFVPGDKIALLQKYIEDQEIEREQNGTVVSSLAGLVFRPHLERSYPEKDLASTVLGFVSQEGQGYYGIEGQYNDMLAGQEQTVWFPSDPNLVEDLPDIPPGASLVLTIDREIQAMVEDALDAAVEVNGAESGTVIVMDVKTGEIWAMASTPRLDLNEYWRYPEIYPGSTPFNRAITQAYEPGSVFKVLTMAAALDSKSVEPTTSFFDTGVFEVGGIYVRNWDGAAWGPQDMLGCLEHSLNVCLAWVGTQMGSKTFYSYMERFGFGRFTGIDLSGESTGRLKSPGDGDWYPADLGTNTFGQGIAVTPIQMVAAISALSNGGQMAMPHVVRSIIDQGSQYNIHPQFIQSPISAETAQVLTEMLAQSLESEDSDALVEGYRLAGKTGTAEIPTPEGYTRGVTNASFVGWGPVDDPRFIVYVWFEKPESSIWGSVVAAPVFSEIVQRLVVLLNLPPDDVRLGLSGQ